MLEVVRSTQRKGRPGPDDEVRWVVEIVDLVAQYADTDTEGSTTIRRCKGWKVNRKRAARV